MFGPGDDYQVVPDLTMVEALEECADGLRITGQRECVSVCVSIDAMVSGSQVRGSVFLCSHGCHGLRITGGGGGGGLFVFLSMPWSQNPRSGSAFLFVFPLMSWSQNHRSEEVCFCLCSHQCRGLRITDQRECVFVCVPIDAVVSGSPVRGSAFLFVSIDVVVSESQVRGSVFLFVFPLMLWSQNHRSEGVRFCLCSH